jgi:hypothetical protein
MGMFEEEDGYDPPELWYPEEEEEDKEEIDE